MRRALLLLLSLAAPLPLAGCGWFARPAPVAGAPHYVLGSAYQADGVWRYPRASDSADETGIATVQPDGHAALTTDGEAYDPGALAAAHPTLQLPAIARLTNLANGRQILVRLNDRGPAAPSRLMAVTPRAAALLGFAEQGAAPVRLQVLEAESRAAVRGLRGEPAPLLAVAAAPRGAVLSVALAPPSGTSASPRGQHVPDTPAAAASIEAAEPATTQALPLRLPETVGQTTPRPVLLMVEMGTFSGPAAAARQRAKAAGLGARIETTRTGRTVEYRVRVGPFADIAQADRALGEIIRAGVPDARITAD